MSDRPPLQTVSKVVWVEGYPDSGVEYGGAVPVESSQFLPRKIEEVINNELPDWQLHSFQIIHSGTTTWHQAMLVFVKYF